jgi:hypothetical protein
MSFPAGSYERTLMRTYILAFTLPACLFAGCNAQALEIYQYDRLAPQDQFRFVSGLVRGAIDILTKAGHADQARKVAQLFPDPDHATATPIFKSALAHERDVDSKRSIEEPDATRLEIEDAMVELLKKNGIAIPDSFYTVNRDFRARLPFKPL